MSKKNTAKVQDDPKIVAGIDVDAFLTQNLSPKKTSSSKPKPEVDIPVESVCWNCEQENAPNAVSCSVCKKPLHIADRLIELYRAMNDASASYNALELRVIEVLKEEYEERAKGDFTKTLNVPGRLTPGMQYSFKDAFKAIPPEKEEALRRILGAEFDKFFVQKRTIKMVDTSNEAIGLLLAALGPEKFKQIFSIQKSIETRPDMDRRQFLLPAEARLALEQHKPAGRPITEK